MKNRTDAQLNSSPSEIHKSSLSYHRLLALFDISERIHQASDLNKLLHDILQAAIINLDAERGLIILTDETGGHYRSVASETMSMEDTAFSTTIVQRTLKCKKTLLSSDLKRDRLFADADSIHKLNILSCICVPLIIPGHDKAVGTLYVDQRMYKKMFTEEDVHFLERLANLAAITIRNISDIDKIISENIRLRREVGKKYEFPELIGQSSRMQRIFHDIERILNDNSTVLLIGESGNGKEVVAKAIHYNGNRREKPFYAINCGALPDTILEAELFGSIRGAFTGAVDKIGLLEAANGGTLFLDEIPHTSEAMQIRLLRFLQEREIRRVGDTKRTKVDVRLICATNEDLQNAIREGHFRKDFFYRINVVTLEIPPLRERREDIPLLARHFLTKYCQDKGKQIKGFGPGVIKALMNYDWAENNVRELENEIERTVVFARDGDLIRLKDLSQKLNASVLITPRDSLEHILTAEERLLTYDELERKYIQHVITRVNGNQSQAAQILGIPRTTLRARMKKLGLTK